MHACGAVNTRPSLACSLACPEINGRKRSEQDGMERLQMGRTTEWLRTTERDEMDNKTEQDGNKSILLTPPGWKGPRDLA
jgi:hypothetical protein